MVAVGAAGNGNTVTLTVLEAVQVVKGFTAVTVYTVETVGLATTTFPVVALKAVAGDHVQSAVDVKLVPT